MPAVAEVQFKAAGSQQVITAFKSVGNAAQEGTTKISQNSSAMKTMGQGMKSSVSGIASAASAFATLSLSVVNTWRAYRDLTDAQIAVDKANLRVKKTTEAIRKSEAEVAKLKKESAKGGLEQVAATHKIQLMEQKLAKDRKEHKKTALELKVEEDAINLARKTGVPSSKKLQDAENKLALQKEQLGVQTDVASEAQERFNDTQQNFYLSILPTALSGFASLSMAFSGLKTMLTGGGGLAAGLGPIGLILTSISLAIVAFKTNFLGLRDAVGGVIKWLQDRFGAWKDTIQEVFGFIQKGDWSGAFNRIIEAATAFWEDLQKSVPFFGGVAKLADQISKGDWTGAFNTIRDAAVFFWTELKKAIPLFGTVENIVKAISTGKWGDAFEFIKKAAVSFWADLVSKVPFLGDLATYLRTKLELATATAKAEFNLMKDSLTKPGGPIDLINQGLAKLGTGDIVGGFSGIWTGFDKAVGILNTRFNDWVKLNFGVDLGALETQAAAIGAKILDGIKSGLTFVARTWIDPIVTQLLDPTVWTNAFLALGGGVVAIGTAIWNFIAGAIAGAASDPKGASTWWSQIGQAIWDGLTVWFSTNLPKAQAAFAQLMAGFTTAVKNASVDIQNLGITWWNSFIDGVKAGIEATRKNPAADFLFLFNQQAKDAFNSPEWKQLGHVAMIKPEVIPDTKQADTLLSKWTGNVEKIKPKIPVSADTSQALKLAKQAQARIDDMRATINVSSHFTGFGHGAGFGQFQHGYQGTVKRPTVFIAGEGGRPEDVSVRPRGSVQRGGSGGGGGFSGTINVYVDGVLRPARYDMGARK